MIRIFLFIIPLTSAYRILVIYPSPSISHQSVVRPVIQSLANRGHALTVVTPLPFEYAGNAVQQIDIRELKSIWNATYNAETRQLGALRYTLKAIDTSIEMMEAMFSNRDVIRLREKHFDAVIVEYLGMYATYAFRHMYNATLIGMASFDEIDHRSIGNAWHPIHHAHNSVKAYGEFDVVGRIYAVAALIFSDLIIHPYSFWRNNKIIDTYFGCAYPRAGRVTADLVVVDSPPALGFTRPILPNTIQLGFLHIDKDTKPLPPDLKSFVDDSVHGVIYFSLGSNVKSSHIETSLINIFADVFRNIKYDIVWKWEDSHLKHMPANVKLMPWIPQQDLLRHRNIKLFIMQGGQQSIEEATYHGIPILVIPFYGDQRVNGERIETLGVGKMLRLKDVSTQRLIENIHELIENCT